ncbi:PAS domain S-box protein [Alkalibacillus aidingensis]|uniref:PAS domain S-box protein n=1 Tax=Alkalibacillus aidingensis TaxID=2747607 RepID=UPI0016609C49|nr:PAS domain S-box protein [Alkalibacillus aidingensis]
MNHENSKVAKNKNELLDEYIHLGEEDRFTLVPENAPALIVNLNDEIAYANKFCQHISGYKPEELVKTHANEIIVNESIPLSHLSNDSIQIIQAELLKKNRVETIDVELNSIPIFKDESIIGRYLIIKGEQDYRKHKLVEEIDDDTYYNRLVEYSPHGIIVLKGDIIKQINLLGMNMIEGSNRESVLGRSIYSLIYDEDKDTLRKKVNKVKKGFNTKPTKLKLKKLNGDMAEVEVQVLPTLYQNKKMMHLILRDFTNENEHLDLSPLIATGMAQELNKPIIRIKGFVELIDQGVHDEEYLKVIKEDVNYIQEVIKEILS